MAAPELVQERGLVSVEKLSPDGAAEILRVSVEEAKGMGVTGFLVVYDQFRLLLSAQAVGEGVRENHVELAMSKAKTVLFAGRASRLQREYMEEKGRTRKDYADGLETLLGGGVAIFSDPEKKKLVGAAAFAGGKEEEDEIICSIGITRAGFYTDVTFEKYLRNS